MVGLDPLTEQPGNRMRVFLDFEKAVADLEGKIEVLRHLSSGNSRTPTKSFRHGRRFKLPDIQTALISEMSWEI
jgi:hypothetical protein